MTTPTGTVQAINEALDILENALEPLLAKSLYETMENQNGLDQAKLCAMLPYVVDQLITIYLKTRGIDASTHYVHAELERIKVYFHKIARTEDPTTNSMGRISDQTMQVDKDAANRFIKAALAQATRAGEQELKRLGIEGPTASSHTTWQPRPRDADEQLQQSEPGVHTQPERPNNGEESDHSASISSISAGELPPIKNALAEGQAKRKRPKMDPFTGYSEPRSKKSKGLQIPNSETKGASPKSSDQSVVASTSSPGASNTPRAQNPSPSKVSHKKAKKKSRVQ
ncbi:hypothetical protein M408DRAFT_189564 [Serendipita vermifera MAFF 305830]|uniref:Exosome complex protein n=1 Tax=Serendipita vermifera MAFF 305830 TaxID=933852 RepID=A0A0C3BLK6_SERVB|nr:hypothetical protein M408DRAFT_189564 [Serendipita vermifera MAFF 305830]